MKRIAVTGSSGYIGDRLVSALLAKPGVESVLGLDVREPTEANPPPFRFVRTDVRLPYRDTFVREGIDAAVHLAFVLGPTWFRQRARAVNLDGTRNFLDACRAAGAKRAVALGSATAYGARPDNPPLLMESDPLRAVPAFPYSYDKRLCDEMCRAFEEDRPGMALAVCRPPIVVGATVDNYFSRTLFKPKVWYVRGHDPPMQFVHEDDLCAAVLALLEAGASGPFNISPPGVLRFRELVAEFKRAPWSLPYGLLHPLCRLSCALRLHSLNEMPPGVLNYIRYPWLIDGEKLLRTTGFSFRYSTLESVRAWRRAVVERAAAGAPLPGKIRL